jgi:hypothetical protein
MSLRFALEIASKLREFIEGWEGEGSTARDSLKYGAERISHQLLFWNTIMLHESFRNFTPGKSAHLSLVSSSAVHSTLSTDRQQCGRRDQASDGFKPGDPVERRAHFAAVIVWSNPKPRSHIYSQLRCPPPKTRGPI